MGFQERSVEHNIYADKSSLVLEWLLLVGIKEKQFSVREVARDTDISVGLVQRVFTVLMLKGFIQVVGLRTAKRFILKKPELILKSWLEHYSIVKKCRMSTYRSGFQDRDQILKALIESGLQEKVVLALHSAAEACGYKNTNLQTVELYLLDFASKGRIEKALQLELQERGYEVLLIEPYYKSLIDISLNKQKPKSSRNQLSHSSSLLTFLDLYHFPLRGHEQAEFMIDHVDELRRIFKKELVHGKRR